MSADLRDIEDENPPSLSEQFRDMFVARFGKVAAVPADTPSEDGYPEPHPAFPEGFASSHMRAILVDAYDRGVTSRPTPPEDVAAAIAYLTPIAESATVGRYGEMLRVALAALAAVPAGTPSEGEVLVEGSWFKRTDLPEVLGNFMRSSAEYAREAKDALATLTELRPVREADTIALASRPTPSQVVAALSDADLWDFADDLLAAWDIEDENPPSLSEQFRDMFVARFGKVAAVPADGETEK